MFVSDRYWVKFEVTAVAVTSQRPHGLRYSLTLHGPTGERMVGFDNVHAISGVSGPSRKSTQKFDHKYRFRTVKPYEYSDAANLLEDFWNEVDGVLREIGVIKMKKTLHVGIASYETMKSRTLAIARGQLKPKRDDPKVWFTSVESFAKVLSDRNRALLEIIVREKPTSIAELETMSGGAKSNLSRTLRTMQRYGLVELEKGEGGKLIPHVTYDRIALEMPAYA